VQSSADVDNNLRVFCFIRHVSLLGSLCFLKDMSCHPVQYVLTLLLGINPLIVLGNVQWFCGLILYAVRIFDSYFPPLSLGKQGRGSNARLLRERGTRDGCQLSNNLQAQWH